MRFEIADLGLQIDCHMAHSAERMIHDGRSGETSETGLVDGGHKLHNFGFRIAESAFYSMPYALCPMRNPTSHIPDRSGPLIQADYGVPLPALVVLLGMVDVKMEAPAFATLESTGHDQLRNGGQISQFDEITV